MSRNEILKANGIEHVKDVKKNTRTFTKGKTAITIHSSIIPSAIKMEQIFGNMIHMDLWGK